MRKISLIALLIATSVTALAQSKPHIIQMPIQFGKERIKLTKEYMRKHYGIHQKDITIKPKIIVLHWTEGPTWQSTYKTFYNQAYNLKYDDSKYVGKFGKLNTSAQYLIARNGTIYQLMPDNWMARHVIGLNYAAIGIENVGGMKDQQFLTPAQLKANVALVRYLKKKYPGIKYLIGHYEYGHFCNSKLWKERDKNYFTIKTDPSPQFMRAVRRQVKNLDLLPRKTYSYSNKTCTSK